MRTNILRRIIDSILCLCWLAWGVLVAWEGVINTDVPMIKDGYINMLSFSLAIVSLFSILFACAGLMMAWQADEACDRCGEKHYWTDMKDYGLNTYCSDCFEELS